MNDLITFINNKYLTNIPESKINISNIGSNSWLTGFTEADGYFGVKVTDYKAKSKTRKRSTSASISLRYTLAQRFLDKSNYSIIDVMSKICKYFYCTYKTFYTAGNIKIIVINVQSLEKIQMIIDYYNKYPLLGIKGKNFNDWLKIFNMISNKEHLTLEGK